MVATLPLLAAFLDEPFEPSPYSPASRLFWNEFYLNIERIPEFQRVAGGPGPGRLARIPGRHRRPAQGAAGRLPRGRWRSSGACWRSCARASRADPAPPAALEQYVEANPELRDYAVFRAVGDRRRAAVADLADALRDGTVSRRRLRPGDGATITVTSSGWPTSSCRGWRPRRGPTGRGCISTCRSASTPAATTPGVTAPAFAPDTAAGAPPDPFFAKGQNWGFPPLHPERVRTGGYPYVRAYLRHHMR